MWSADRVSAICHLDWGPWARQREDKDKYVQTAGTHWHRLQKTGETIALAVVNMHH